MLNISDVGTVTSAKESPRRERSIVPDKTNTKHDHSDPKRGFNRRNTFRAHASSENHMELFRIVLLNNSVREAVLLTAAVLPDTR